MSIIAFAPDLTTRRTASPVALPRPRPTPPAPDAAAPMSPRPAPATAAPTRSRDPFVDTLRVAAIGLVVAQHWLMPVIRADGAGGLVTGNALNTPGAWIVTWISQVMPLVFFAGGAAAVYSTRSRGTAGLGPAWVAHRIGRLVAPVLPLAVIWTPLPPLLIGAGVPASAVDTGSRLVGGLLWFLALYTVVVAATPLLLRWHARWRGAEIGVLAAAAVAVDVLRFSTGVEALGYANLVFVWFTVYLVGVSYAEGRLAAVRGSVAWSIAAIGFAATAVAVAVGPYAPSMIGMPGAPLSNMNPPTAVLLSLAVGQLGLALALRDRIVTWAAMPEVARGISAASERLMTIYVWHTPALVAVAGVAVLGFDWSTPAPFGADWRHAMPIWLAALAVVLTVAVRAFGRFEMSPPGPVATASRRVIAAVVLVGSGLLGLTVGGFAPGVGGFTEPTGPLVFSLAIAVGAALLRNRQMPGWLQVTPREKVNS